MDHAHHVSHVDQWDSLTLAGVLSYSFAMSLHCTAMCGPLVGAYMQVAKVQRRTMQLLIYNLGRGFSYMTVAAMLAAVAGGISSYLDPIGKVVAVLAGGFFLLLSARVALGKEALPSGASFGAGAAATIARRVTAVSQSIPAGLRPGLLGLMTVFLPCATLTPVLLLAASTGRPLIAAGILGAFFVGTWPAMSIAPLVPGWLRWGGFYRYKHLILFVFYAGCGVLTLLRPWHHHH